MSSITLYVYKQKILLEILEELKNILGVETQYCEDLQSIQKINETSVKNILLTNCLYLKEILNSNIKFKYPIVCLDNNFPKKKFKNDNRQIELIALPINIKTLIEKLNVIFLKFEFSLKSNVIINNYIINLNKREISVGQKKLKLTEKEKNFLLFLYKSKNPKKIQNILKEVWGYSKGIETHTVETHVHRLRKKFEETFKDKNFIKISTKGYYI